MKDKDFKAWQYGAGSIVEGYGTDAALQFINQVYRLGTPGATVGTMRQKAGRWILFHFGMHDQGDWNEDLWDFVAGNEWQDTDAMWYKYGVERA